MSSVFELSRLIDAMRAATRDGEPVALATITATRGATFRRAGTRMLVHADGRVVCELSGGCPQHDIVQRALRVIASGCTELARYNAESGLDVLLEMGCGGELDVLIEPVADGRVVAFFDALMQALDRRHSVTVATVFALGDDITPPRHALWCNGEVRTGDLGDTGLHNAVADAAASGRGVRARVVRLPATGGIADVLIEHIEPPHALFAIGANATARALLMASRALGWSATLVDSSPERLREATLPEGVAAVHATPQTLHELVTFDRHSSVVVMTHNLEQDLAWLAALHEAPVAYLGAIGSRARTSRMRQELSTRIADLHAPAGLDIGSETPAEIALAITAEITAVRNGRSGGSLRDNGNAMHP